MAQLIAIGLLVAGSIFLYRRFIKDAERVTSRSREKEKELRTGASGTLVKDPVTGEYRVKREDEE